MNKLPLNTPIPEIPFVYLDVETTGLDPLQGDRIIELAMIKSKQGKELKTYEQLINPGRKIAPDAAAIHHITNEMVQDKPYFKEVAKEIRDFWGESVLVIHNAPFDIGFLTVQYQILQYPSLEIPCIDSLVLARKYYRFSGNRLSEIGRLLKIKSDTLHRALSDIRLMQQVFESFLEDLQNAGVRNLEDLLLTQNGAVRINPPGYILPEKLIIAFHEGINLELQYTNAEGTLQRGTFEPLDFIPYFGKKYIIVREGKGKPHQALPLERIIKLELADH